MNSLWLSHFSSPATTHTEVGGVEGGGNYNQVIVYEKRIYFLFKQKGSRHQEKSKVKRMMFFTLLSTPTPVPLVYYFPTDCLFCLETRSPCVMQATLYSLCTLSQSWNNGNPPASTSQAVGFRACTIMPSRLLNVKGIGVGSQLHLRLHWQQRHKKKTICETGCLCWVLKKIILNDLME